MDRANGRGLSARSAIFDGHPATPLTDALARRCSFPSPPLPRPADVAVSGGADSMALLVLAAYATGDVVAWHVDHGLRAGSEREADLVGAAAKRFGAGFRSVRVDLSEGPNIEERARDARRAVLPEGIATGHTADDQAETVVLNMMRGASSRGLGAMRPGPAKPILGLRRSETVALCEAWGLEVVSDPTNDDLRLRRNSVRHRALPLLAEIFERDPVPILCAQADLLREESDYLDGLAAQLDATDCRLLAQAPGVLARRALVAWLGGLSGRRLGRGEIERAMAVARGECVGTELRGGWVLRRRGMRLRAERSPAPSPGADVTAAD